MPAVAPDQDEAVDQLGVGQGQVQAEPPSEGVPDVGRPPTGLAQQLGTLPQVGGHVGRTAVAGPVDDGEGVEAAQPLGPLAATTRRSG